MPSPYRSLDLQRLRQDLLEQHFAPWRGKAESFGVWSEFFAVRWDASGTKPLPLARAELARLVAAAAARTGAEARPHARARCESDHTTLGVGHGRKVWLATSRASSPAECHAEFERAWLGLRAVLAAAHVDLVSVGADPWAAPEDAEPPTEPADVAREQAFAASGPYGLAALRLVARTGVVLGPGSAVLAPLRWQAAQLLAPLAAALHAHSPVVGNVHPGTRCFSARAWQFAAPDHTSAPPRFAEAPDEDRLTQYLDFALDAAPFACGGAPNFATWLERGVGGAYPERADWHAHLASLEPAVRPDGGLEIVVADAQPRAFAAAPLGFFAALLCDSRSVSRVLERFLPRAHRLAERWERAHQEALADPEFASDARATIAIAADVLLSAPSTFFGAPLRVSFVQFAERCSLHGRAPADELLEVFLRRGELDRSALYEHERRLLQPHSAARAG